MAALFPIVFVPVHLWKYAHGGWSAGLTLLYFFNDFFFPYAFLRLVASGVAREKAESSLQDQIASQPSGKFCAVRLTIWEDERPIAQDDGVATFGAGMLIYSSGATTFKLRPSDVLGVKHFAGFRLASNPRFELRFENRPTKGFGAFDSALPVWLDNPPTAVGEAILPPLTPLAPGPTRKRWRTGLWG